MLKFKTRHLLSASALLLTLNTQAGTYLTIEAGQALSDLNTRHFQAFNQEIINKGGTAHLSEDKKNTALLLGIGYQYHPYLAVEVNYLHPGEFSASSYTRDTNTQAVTRTRHIKETAKQQGLGLSAVGLYPVNDQWSLSGQLGLVWLDQTATGSARGQSVNAAGTVIATENESFRRSNNEWAPMVGLGAGYQLHSHWQVQLNWRRMLGTEPGLLGKQDIDLLTAGVRYRF